MIPMLFFRGDYFHLVEFMDPDDCGKSLPDQALEHVKLNPGTTKVEDMEQNVLWSQEAGDA